MFLKKKTAILLVLSILEFSKNILCENYNEAGEVMINETSTFSSSPGETSDSILEELEEHYLEIENRKVSEAEQTKNIANKTELLPENESNIFKTNVIARLDEANETDDIETLNKYIITTLIPDLLASSSELNDNSSSEVIYSQPNNNIINITVKNTSNSGENYDDDYDSRSLLEINETSANTNEMKHNILYTEESDENEFIKTHNHSIESEETIQDIHEQKENETDDNNFEEPEMLIATTTMTIPTSRKEKQIQSIKKRLPHEKLKNFIEDPYTRTPIAAIIDPTNNVLERARILWKNSLRPNTALDIILLGLVNGTTPPLIYNLDNTRTFLAGLNSMKESSKANPFHGIVKATELIPYDSAIYICVEAVEPDTETANFAGIFLLKKRIKLYLIWFGDKKDKDNNEPPGGMLGKIAIRSGGEIIYMDDLSNMDNRSHEIEDNMITLISNSFQGSQEIDIPVDTTVSGIHMKIDTQMRTAAVEAPTGG